MTLPNLLTGSRFALAVIVAIAFAVPSPESLSVALVAFAAGILTDVVDGPLARITRRTSEIGATLDPLADKALVYALLVPVAWQEPAYVGPVALLAARDIIVTALRARAPKALRPNLIAKAKTASLYLAGLVLLLHAAADVLELSTAYGFLIGGVVLSLVSGLAYLAPRQLIRAS